MGYEALVKRDTPDKLQQRSIKCIFIGYPKETMGYYFYFPPENKIVVGRYAEFFEKNLITQEVSGRPIDLEEIQDEDTSPSEITSKIPMEVEGFEPPQKEDIPIRRSERTSRAPNRLSLNLEAKEHSLGNLNEPTSYKATMLDSESNKWIDAMNAEIQSMMDNMVWVLVDLPPGCKAVGSKWIFKKKTNMDGIIHTYKARLVAKGYTQLYRVNYKETFSPVADIKAIRILISIVAYYDYEIWQMDIKTAFLNGYLDEDIYMVQPEGYVFILNGGAVDWKSSKQNTTAMSATEAEYIVASKAAMEARDHSFDLGSFTWYYTYAYIEDGVTFIATSSLTFLAKVDWKSSKQSTTAMSATEAEYIAASEALMEVVWIRKFISGLGIVLIINEPIRMFCDNSTALHFANEPGAQKGTRHYHRRYHYVRECIALGEIRFLKVHTDDNLADHFTKALPKGKLTQHARSMGLRLAKVILKHDDLALVVNIEFVPSIVEEDATGPLIELIRCGERSRSTDNSLLGEFELSNLPLAPRGVTKARIQFDIDPDGILKVSAVEPTTRQKNNITITNDNGRLTKDEIDKMLEDAERYKYDDQLYKKKAEAYNALKDYIYAIKTKLKDGNIRRKLFLEDLKKMDDVAEEAMVWLDVNKLAEVSRNQCDRGQEDRT
ncbi:retrotransposon protein, putative, ty1-copia subclass [Tanacetum coccineum]